MWVVFKNWQGNGPGPVTETIHIVDRVHRSESQHINLAQKSPFCLERSNKLEVYFSVPTLYQMEKNTPALYMLAWELTGLAKANGNFYLPPLPNSIKTALSTGY